MIESIVQESRPRGLVRLQTLDLCAFYDSRAAIEGINLNFIDHAVTAIVGPSGCGKSTLLRCLNRVHEENPGARVTGIVALNGANVYDPSFEPIVARRAVGMLLQHPSPFPTMSILENAVAGLRYSGRKSTRREQQEVGEDVLRAVGLWEEVKDILSRPGSALSGGQQQRLCLARALAVKPQILLLDEPCAALDPGAAAVVEELIVNLASKLTIVAVTHNLEQARRISQQTAFLLAEQDGVGRLVEVGPTEQLFSAPRQSRTADYLAGRFG